MASLPLIVLQLLPVQKLEFVVSVPLESNYSLRCLGVLPITC